MKNFGKNIDEIKKRYAIPREVKVAVVAMAIGAALGLLVIHPLLTR